MISAQVTKGAFPLNASGNASDGSSNDGSSIEVLKDPPTVYGLGFRVTLENLFRRGLCQGWFSGLVFAFRFRP